MGATRDQSRQRNGHQQMRSIKCLGWRYESKQHQIRRNSSARIGTRHWQVDHEYSRYFNGRRSLRAQSRGESGRGFSRLFFTMRSCVRRRCALPRFNTAQRYRMPARQRITKEKNLTMRPAFPITYENHSSCTATPIDRILFTHLGTRP